MIYLFIPRGWYVVTTLRVNRICESSCVIYVYKCSRKRKIKFSSKRNILIGWKTGRNIRVKLYYTWNWADTNSVERREEGTVQKFKPYLTHDNAVEQCNNAKQLGTSGIIRKQFVAVIVRVRLAEDREKRWNCVYLILYQQPWLSNAFPFQYRRFYIYFFSSQCNHLVELQSPYNKERSRIEVERWCEEL